uniref:Tumor necrosis factor receptor superfamily member 6 n=1 Tax=Sinocyclocheilus anshuiensis TaxID=1608454 RepID=A0A671KT00_9TELE
MYVRPHLVVFLWCAMLTEGLAEGRRLRTRRGVCKNGTYQYEGRSCCLCQTGHRFLSHCTDKNDTKCEWCEHGTYIDHPNNDDKCQPCKICDSNANMDKMLNCSSSSNTVCRCKDNYYCDKGDLCKACYPCDTCEKHGVKEKCTETTNTVCHDAKEPVHLQVVIVAVLVSLILVAGVGVVVFWLCRKCKYHFKGRPIEPAVHLTDLDLDSYLLDIVEVLDWKTVKRVARRSGMRNTEIEEHELNNKNDVKEQKYTLLQAWSQRQGLRGAYPALIKTLHEMKQRTTADEIQTIVEKGQTERGVN